VDGNIHNLTMVNRWKDEDESEDEAPDAGPGGGGGGMPGMGGMGGMEQMMAQMGGMVGWPIASNGCANLTVPLINGFKHTLFRAAWEAAVCRAWEGWGVCRAWEAW
jgi:hypothetical protein